MRTVDAIKHHIPLVLKHYDLPPITGNRHFTGECPMCGKKNKYRMDNHDNKGTWICSCGAGDIWTLLQITQSKDFKTLAKEIDSLIGNTYSGNNHTKQVPNDDANTLREKAIAKFSNIEQLKGTLAEQYLLNRHIKLSKLDNIKGLRKLT